MSTEKKWLKVAAVGWTILMIVWIVVAITENMWADWRFWLWEVVSVVNLVSNIHNIKKYNKIN